MNNKVYIVAALTVASAMVAGAQETGSIKMVQKNPTMMREGVNVSYTQGQAMVRTSQAGAPAVGGQGQGQMMQVQMVAPTTGDPAVDAQLAALTKEMEAKIKAIREEYGVKIKAAIGTRKLTAPTPVMGTTTGIMRRVGGEEGNPNARGAVASGTMMRGEMRQQGTMPGAPARPAVTRENDNGNMPQGQPKGGLGSMLRGLFGGER